MSQAGRPRPRYIAFRLASDRPVARRAVQNALTGQARRAGVPDDQAPRLTRYAFPHGIVWSDHRSHGTVRRVLAALTWVIEDGQKRPVRAETLATSGTILALTRRVGVLGRRRERRRPAGGGGRPDAGGAVPKP